VLSRGSAACGGSTIERSYASGTPDNHDGTVTLTSTSVVTNSQHDNCAPVNTITGCTH
jgi:hypothetical protein